MRLRECHNFHDFHRLAQRRLPSPIFDYIDGGADDEVTLRQNTASFERCDLVPNVLRGVESVDISVTVMGQKLATPFYCSPTALQRLFHHQGEGAVAAAAAKFGTMFGVSSLGSSVHIAIGLLLKCMPRHSGSSARRFQQSGKSPIE
jgi:L-lactate dehydrogenase (cytochrome)